MKLDDIIKRLEEEVPPRYAEEWDNIGLLVGDHEQDIRRVLISLDANDATVDYAVESKADLIITHHPLIFSPMKTVTEQDFIGRRIRTMIKNDISYYAMHTNFDVVKMADLNARALMLNHPSVLEETGRDESGAYGFGRIGRLDKEITLGEFAAFVKKVAFLPKVRVYGDIDARVRVAAIASGSGKSAIRDALEKGAQVIVTGDVDYHTGIDANAKGIAVIDAGHYGTEYVFISYMAYLMEQLFPELTILSQEIRQPYHVV